MMRSGVIAKKVGMTRIFNDTGDQIPVTVLQLENCQVISHLTTEKNGYTAVQLGVGKAKVNRTSRPMRGHFAKAKVEPKRKLAEFRVSEDNLIDVGLEITADHFVAGQFVDVTGTSIGKGFAGAMKRHHFKGLGASHGVSVSHRSHGSTGQCQDPGRVFKGKKMAGHLGDVRKTTQNLRIEKIDPERGLILVKGTIPGSKGQWILVKDAIKKSLPSEVPIPGAFRKLDPYVEVESPKQKSSVESTQTESENVGEVDKNLQNVEKTDEILESDTKIEKGTDEETPIVNEENTESAEQSTTSSENDDSTAEQSEDKGEVSATEEQSQEGQKSADTKEDSEHSNKDTNESSAKDTEEDQASKNEKTVKGLAEEESKDEATETAEENTGSASDETEETSSDSDEKKETK